MKSEGAIVVGKSRLRILDGLRRAAARWTTIAIAVLFVAGCQTVQFGGGAATKTEKPVADDVDSILAAANERSAAKGVELLLSRGFTNIAEDKLRNKVSSWTLFINATAIFQVSSGKAVIVDEASGKKAKSNGRWAIRGNEVCHSSPKQPETCTAVFLRGDETLCWPGFNRGEDSRGLLRHCVLFKGNGTKGERPPGAELARLRFQPPGAGAIGSDKLAEIATGRTLKIGESYLYYGPSGTVEVRDRTLGKELTSRGTWRIKADQLCHSVARDHEFCLTLAAGARGTTTCRPVIGTAADPREFARDCAWVSGNGLLSVTPQMVINAATDLSDKQVVPHLSFWGFKQIAANNLQHFLAGNTLAIGRSRLYLAPDGALQVIDRTMPNVLSGQGKWTVRGSDVCHSTGPGHEFCMTVLAAGNDLICWPLDGQGQHQPDFLRECRLLVGNQAS